MSGLRFKRVMRLDRANRIFRLFKIIGERGRVGDGHGYSSKFSVALEPCLFRYRRGLGSERLVTLIGVRFHYARSYGGRFA